MRRLLLFVGLAAVLAIGVAAFTVDWRPVPAQVAPPVQSPTAEARAEEPDFKESVSQEQPFPRPRPKALAAGYKPRKPVDTGGYMAVTDGIRPWKESASLAEIGEIWRGVGHRTIEDIDRQISAGMTPQQQCGALLAKVAFLNYEGESRQAYDVLTHLRDMVEGDEQLASESLYTLIVLQGVTALRIGENENCILCRGESSCILPIAPAARHTNSYGSRQAALHFQEYLEQFPTDLEIRWLLNLAHMTLGEHPQGVDSRFVISLKKFNHSELDIGKFRDVGHVIGVNRLNQAGGAILEDFNNDGHLDIFTSTFDPATAAAYLHNGGQGKFSDQTSAAGISEQLGGLNCVQTDYNNDGFMDVLIVRGAWLKYPIRPSLLRNDQNGAFTDVTQQAGLAQAVNSIAASWADYDNDGWLDLFICCEAQRNRLYRNLGNGKFEEVAQKAGIPAIEGACKGVAWIDHDNDGRPDLFLNYLTQDKQSVLLHNEGNGTFRDISAAQGIDGPAMGFACWAWDFDNDGWQDIFATSFDRSLGDVLLGMLGEPHHCESNRLYRNKQGQGFEDVTKKAGLDAVFSTMGSNFGDFDNDGYLDMYLGTGDPNLAMLVPNRMFKNVGGERFADITASSGTGNLQKGHGVACGDWDRDGDVDLFVEMGGAINGDKYHNIMFQNPGNKNHSLTLKLVGKQSNRAAIGARIKVVTTGDQPLTVHRHITSGSSFGANPLQQTIGLAGNSKIARLEIHWPTSGTTQVFEDVAADQALEITEFSAEYRKLEWQPVPLPE